MRIVIECDLPDLMNEYGSIKKSVCRKCRDCGPRIPE